MISAACAAGMPRWSRHDGFTATAEIRVRTDGEFDQL
jgi:hypothetical protein